MTHVYLRPHLPPFVDERPPAEADAAYLLAVRLFDGSATPEDRALRNEIFNHLSRRRMPR